MATSAFATDLITKPSPHSVAQTADKLIAAVKTAGAKVFARINHGAGATSVGADIGDMELVIFGNPKIGTPVLQAAPRAGLDLPLHVLIWQEKGQVLIGYEDPATLKSRYNAKGADEAFAKISSALSKLTTAATE